MQKKPRLGFFLKKVRHPKLKQSIAVLEAQHGMSKMSHAQITNCLAIKLSKLESKKVKFRGVEAVKVGKVELKGKSSNNGGVGTPDESAFTRYSPNWRELSEEKQNKEKTSREKSSLDLVATKFVRLRPSSKR